MMRAMYSAVSGLKTHQTKMDVIGNNIANVKTVAFKESLSLIHIFLCQRTDEKFTFEEELTLLEDVFK